MIDDWTPDSADFQSPPDEAFLEEQANPTDLNSTALGSTGFHPTTELDSTAAPSTDLKIDTPEAPLTPTLPFSLLITGPLTLHEREKLLDLLSRENIGIREVDLEPQFLSQKVLIPRVSEYAGVLIVQALRGTRAHLRLGPSDLIFATDETREDPNSITPSSEPSINHYRVQNDTPEHSAEAIRISADSSIPDLPGAQLIDFIIASTTLESDTVEAQNSPEYQAVLDALIRELKYKAHRKGGIAITHFSLELVPLSLPSQYRLTVSGSAVKETKLDRSL